MGRKEDVAAAVIGKLTQEHGFYVHEENTCVLKDVANYAVEFYHHEEKPLRIGFFHYDTNFSKVQKSWLWSVLERPEFSDEFGGFEDDKDWFGDSHILKSFNWHNTWTNADTVEFLVGRLDWLEKTVLVLGIT
jgi:hypothetical protein